MHFTHIVLTHFLTQSIVLDLYVLLCVWNPGILDVSGLLGYHRATLSNRSCPIKRPQANRTCITAHGQTALRGVEQQRGEKGGGGGGNKTWKAYAIKSELSCSRVTAGGARDMVVNRNDWLQRGDPIASETLEMIKHMICIFQPKLLFFGGCDRVRVRVFNMQII